METLKTILVGTKTRSFPIRLVDFRLFIDSHYYCCWNICFARFKLIPTQISHVRIKKFFIRNQFAIEKVCFQNHIYAVQTFKFCTILMIFTAEIAYFWKMERMWGVAWFVVCLQKTKWNWDDRFLSIKSHLLWNINHIGWLVGNLYLSSGFGLSDRWRWTSNLHTHQ